MQEIVIPELPTECVSLSFDTDVELYIRREDKTHPFVSGNKYRKLKYNLQYAHQQGFDKLITFGGAYSNHIAATAYAGYLYGFKSIGVIRGDELREKIAQNPTLSFAQQCGMAFHFVTREQYRLKETSEFRQTLTKLFGEHYYIPEGGTNALAIQGCEQILSAQDMQYDVICTAVGTGGTITGLINASGEHQRVLGFPALKGAFLSERIAQYTPRRNWQLIHDYHWGGYAKYDGRLIDFLNEFYNRNAIPLDPIYTGKMLYGVIDLIGKGYFKSGTKILAIHTGGLQGIAGINQKLKTENKIQYEHQII